MCVRVCHARARIYQSMLSPRHRALDIHTQTKAKQPRESEGGGGVNLIRARINHSAKIHRDAREHTDGRTYGRPRRVSGSHWVTLIWMLYRVYVRSILCSFYGCVRCWLPEEGWILYMYMLDGWALLSAFRVKRMGMLKGQ